MTFKTQAGVFKYFRKVRNLSQLEVRDHLGLETAQFISNIERGLAAIPFDWIKKLYFIPKNKLIKAMVKDYELSIRKALK